MKNKRVWLVAALAIALGLAALIWALSTPPAAETVAAAFSRALTADGRFEFSCMLETGGEAREYFWLTGERSGDKRHLSGRVLGGPLELYYADQAIYRYDEADGCWRRYAAADLEAAAALYAELEPAGTFAFSQLIEMSYAGRGERDQRGLFMFSAIPAPTGWVADFFTDVSYTLYVDRRGEPQAAAMSAVMIDDPDTRLTAMLLFWPEQGIEIQPPQM